MPIRYTDDPATLDAVQPDNVPEQYIIFFSSRGEDGGLWCPYCREIEQAVQDKFAGTEDGAPSALVVFVGQRAAWKSPENPFRGAPWRVDGVPTIIRQRDGARLDDAVQGLATF